MKTGNNGLFIPGPTNMPMRLRAAMDVALQDNRAPDFPELTLPLFRDLKPIFKTETGEVFIFPATGSAGLESALANTLSPGDKVLATSLGIFSQQWINTAKAYHMDVDVCEVEWGHGVDLVSYEQKIGADKNHSIKAVLVTQNETATGVTSNVAAVRKILDAHNHPALLMMDGVSSIASIDCRMDEWGVDVAVTGSQKGFMLPTGLAIVAVSQKAMEAGKTATSPRWFLSYENMRTLNADGFFPYTPATTLLHGLRASIDMINEEGLENIFARHYRLAEGVRRGIRGWGFDVLAATSELESNTVSVVRIPDGFDSTEVVHGAYNRYNLSLGMGLAKIAGKAYRIGHLGNFNEIMALQALAGAEMAMRDVGIDVEPGSGVAAAQEYFRNSNEQIKQAAE